MSKIKNIENSLKREGSFGVEQKESKAKRAEQIVASQFTTEVASASKVKGLAIRGASTKNTSQPNNPNARERKKNVARDGHGRLKGQKNLKRVKDEKGKVIEIINQHGVSFTPQDQKTLKSAVDSLERKRKNLANSELGLLVGFDLNGQLTGEKDPIMTREVSKGLQQFKSREEFENCLREIKEFTSKDYIKDLTNDMKSRYIKTIANTTDMTDSEFEEIKKAISKMSQKEFAMRFGHGIFGTITLYYERYDKTDKREERIKRAKDKMTAEELKEYEQRQAETEAAGGGSAVNVEDIKRRLGIGEDSIQVDTKNNRYTQFREQQKAQRARKREKREAEAKAYEDKYQKFLSDWGLEDNEKTREKFRSYH